MSLFTESALEQSIMTLFEQQQYTPLNGEFLERDTREVLLKSHPAFEREKQTLAGRVKALAGRLFAPHGFSHFFRVEVPQKLLRKKNHIGL